MSRNKQLPSVRQTKVAGLIHEILTQLLRKARGLDAKLLTCPITLTRVNVTADLKIAHCYYVPFNTKLTLKEIESALEKSKYALRADVTKEINLKFSPELRFHFDESFENAERIEELIRSLNK